MRAYVDRATQMCHWGPTPARLVASSLILEDANDRPLAEGVHELTDTFPTAVRPGGTYNGRDCTDYAHLADCLRKAGHLAAARELQALLGSAFAHVEGRVKEA